MNEGLAIIVIAVLVIVLLVILSVAGRDPSKKKKKEKETGSKEAAETGSPSVPEHAGKRNPALLHSAGMLGSADTGGGLVRHFPQEDARKKNSSKVNDVIVVYTYHRGSGQMICPFCGAENRQQAEVCETCGSIL